jgi:tyrosinase
MTDDQVKELRAAFNALQAISDDDDRSYGYFSGLHGLPLPQWCNVNSHGTLTFVHWHRAYLWRFETALRATGHDVMLPWWDWVNVRDIPPIYAEENDANGDPNPLNSARVSQRARDEGAAGAAGPRDRRAVYLSQFDKTFREPGQLGGALATADQIDRDSGGVLSLDDFESFTGELENIHGDVHIWVGGHMTDIPFAAFDPIFWAHHTQIDRIWRMWQLGHKSASLPGRVMNTVMQPFNKTAGDTVDPTLLGYDYALSTTQISVEAA